MNPLLKELHDRAHGRFEPVALADFIGRTTTASGCGARIVAEHLQRTVAFARQQGNAPIKLLLNGAPGCGKSMAALWLMHLLGCDKFATTKLNGTQVKVEKVEELANSLHYKSLFGDYRLVHIDEADTIPTVAQVRFLTLLDDLPSGAAILCTSNCRLKDFENRFQTRFQVFEVVPPTAEEIAGLVGKFLDNPQWVTQIATLSCGNVRQAMLETLQALQKEFTTPLALAA